MSTREEAAAALRAEITACDAVLLDLIDGLKDTFGAKLKYVQLSNGTEIGSRKEFELGGFIAVPAPRAKEKGRSSLDMLKEEEAAHLAAHAQQAGAATRSRLAGRKRK